MSDKTEDPQGTSQTQNQATPPDGTQSEPSTVEVRKGELDGLHTQLKQFKAQLAEANKYKAEAEKAEADRKEAELLKAQNYEELKATWATEKAELQKQSAEKDAKFRNLTAKNALLLAGMDTSDDRGKLAMDGVLVALSEENPEDVEVWVSTYKEKHPTLFEQSKAPSSVPRVGGVNSGSTNGDLNTRLANGDEAAMREAFKAATGLD